MTTITLRQLFDTYPIPIQWVADKMGIDRSTLSKKVSGIIPISEDELKEIQAIVNGLGNRLTLIEIK